MNRQPESFPRISTPDRGEFRPSRMGGATMGMVLALTAAALAVRLAGIGRDSLWLDEGVSEYVSRKAPMDIVTWVHGDVHLPLYYLVLHAWRFLFGGSEPALRSLSAVGSALTVPVVFSLARRAGSRTAEAAAIAAGFCALGVFTIFYGQVARSYALMGLATALSWERLLAARAKGGMLRWSAYAAATSLAIGLHHFAALSVLAQCLHAAITARSLEGRRLLRPWFAALFASVLPLVPWIGTVREQVGRVLVRGEFWTRPPVPADLVRTAWEFSGSWPLLAVLAILVAIALAPAPARVAIPRGSAATAAGDARLALVLWAVVPVLAAYGVSLAWNPVYITRGLLPSALPLYVLAAAGASSLPPRARQCALAVTLLALLQADVDYARGPHRDPWREAVRLVESRARKGEAVLVSASWNKRYVWDYYARRPDLAAEPFPDPGRTWAGPPAAAIASRLAPSPGVWVVLSRSADPAGVLRAAAGRDRGPVLDTVLTLRPLWLSRRPQVLAIRVVHYEHGAAPAGLPPTAGPGHSPAP